MPDVPAPPTGECAIRKNNHVTQLGCDDPRFTDDTQPFAGRDIIYVHGFALDHIKGWIGEYAPARTTWPSEPAEFLDPAGYFRRYAEDYWAPHIHENLFDPVNPGNPIAGWQWTASDAAPVYKPKANRYLAVAWSTNQTLEYAQHAFLEQVRLAIATGKNVHTPPTYPSDQVRPFCFNGCIVVSHSAGSLVTTTALGRAAKGKFGPGGSQVAKRIRAHVSFEGAISGSTLASAAMAVGVLGSAVPGVVCDVFEALVDSAGACDGDTSFVTHSIFRDLMPIVAQTVWRSAINHSPVPTVTVAGGHPWGNYAGVTKILLPGLDDGVVSMNSACGNPNPVFPFVLAPSGAVMKSRLGAFEMSSSPYLLARAVKNFISHKHLMDGAAPFKPLYFAGGCTPYLSPTGMVMPVRLALKFTPWNTRSRYRNHYSIDRKSVV